MMDEYQQETTRLVLAVVFIAACIVLLTSCSGTGHTTRSSSCPAYSINKINYNGECEI